MNKFCNVVLWACFICSALFVSCSDDEQEREKPFDPKDGLPVNLWMEKILRADYYWTKEIKDNNKLDFFAEPQDFFKSLLSPKDGKTRANGVHQYYSYISKNKNYTGTKTSISSDDTYGFEFVGFNMCDKNGNLLGFIYARVLYVLPDSPAEKAGLKRGDWITGINGTDNITNEKYKNLLKGGTMNLTIGQENPKVVPIEASRAVEDNPLYYDSIIKTGGKTIGYLVYNHFTSGPKDYTDSTYDNEMKAKFENFKAQNVDEFILDLRYNGGGYLTSSNLLAGMLIPEKNKNDIYCITTNNQGKTNIRTFNSEGNVPHLNLKRLYVLTSIETASASEAVINGLRPYMEVILLGEITEGKNVGSVYYSEKEYEWAIQPITLRITSKDTSIDYSNGLEPTLYWSEFDLDLNVTDELLPLGNENEFMLSKAIELITGRMGRTKSVLQPDRKMKLIYKSIDRNQTNGVLVTPEYMQNAFLDY